MIRMNRETSGQPHEIAIGPPLLKPCPKVVKQPARIEMIENEIAKLEKPPAASRPHSTQGHCVRALVHVRRACATFSGEREPMVWRLDPPRDGRKYILSNWSEIRPFDN
jgi:hypothetical protein